MTTVYAVTVGEYSDYHILGIYSTQERAHECIKAYGAAAGIEEYELDEYKPRIGYYDVSMNRDYEATAYSYILQPYDLIKNKKGIPNYIEDLGFQRFSIGGENACAYWKVEAKDELTAIKIVSEKVTKILALGIWDDSSAVARLIK